MWCKKSFLMWRLLLDLGRPTGADTTINANHIPAGTADKKIIKKKGKTEQNQNKFLFVYIYWEACYYKVVKSYRRLYDGAKGSVKFRRLCEATSSLFFNKSGSILASLRNDFDRFSLTSPCQKLKRPWRGLFYQKYFSGHLFIFSSDCYRLS